MGPPGRGWAGLRGAGLGQIMGWVEFGMQLGWLRGPWPSWFRLGWAKSVPRRDPEISIHSHTTAYQIVTNCLHPSDTFQKTFREKV